MTQKSHFKMPKELLKALRGESAHGRLLHRLHSVVLVLRGYSASEAGRIYSDSPRAVAYWVKRFKRQGVNGLRDEARPGRPTTLTGQQLKDLQRFIKHSASAGKRMNAE